MSDKKIDFVDLTKDEQEDSPEKHGEKHDEIIERFSDIIFTDCARSGIVMFGLDTESTGVAVIAAGEALLWFSKLAGKIDDEGLEQLREKAKKVAEKRRQYFKDTGLEDLIKDAGKIAQKMQELEGKDPKSDADGGDEDDK